MGDVKLWFDEERLTSAQLDLIQKKIQKIEDERAIALHGFSVGDFMPFMKPEGTVTHLIVTSVTSHTMTLQSFGDPVFTESDEQKAKLRALKAQWNRAKMQRNKNLMRDIERAMECIRGY